MAGAAGAALFAQASLKFYLQTHSLVKGAFLVEQTCFVIAFLVRRSPSAVTRNPAAWLLASGCNVGRALMEERLPTGSSAYDAYRCRVRWRLVPGLW